MNPTHITFAVLALPFAAIAAPVEVPSSDRRASEREAIANVILAKSVGKVKIDRITLVGSYAISSTLYGEGGGQFALVSKQIGKQTTWQVVTSGGGAFNAASLTRHGVPAAIAAQLIQQHEASYTTTKQELQAFRHTWAKSNPDLAPFLGHWATSGIGRRRDKTESSIAIFPSTSRDRVCIVGMGENLQYVSVGKVSGDRLTTASDLFFRSTHPQSRPNLMRGIAGDTAYRKTDERQTLYSPSLLNTWGYTPATRQKLQAYGCWISEK